MYMNRNPVFSVIFFKTDSGRVPVQRWLRNLDKSDRKVIGEDIKLVQFRWPLGMPLIRKIERDLWEIRSNLSDRRIARTLFTMGPNEIVLLHGFIKKSQRIPKRDLDVARNRRNAWHGGR